VTRLCKDAPGLLALAGVFGTGRTSAVRGQTIDAPPTSRIFTAGAASRPLGVAVL